MEGATYLIILEIGGKNLSCQPKKIESTREKMNPPEKLTVPIYFRF